jgi:hypothetical protein
MRRRTRSQSGRGVIDPPIYDWIRGP